MKIQDICYIIGTVIFKIEEEMTEKPQVANPHKKMGRIHFSQYGLLLMSLCIFNDNERKTCSICW